MKLAVNHIVISQTTALAYSLTLLEKSDLDTDTFLSLIGASPLSSPYFNFKYKPMVERSFKPTAFSTTLMTKDVR